MYDKAQNLTYILDYYRSGKVPELLKIWKFSTYLYGTLNFNPS